MKRNNITVAPQTGNMDEMYDYWKEDHFGNRDDFYDFMTTPTPARALFLSRCRLKDITFDGPVGSGVYDVR
ncbi:MAG: hypothetical protein HDS25_01085 [Bacteroides sp.]|nr:hypothetical protein [Bacteroides sp.]MBD5294900.1 hypothetical protein [Bacteroides sp.]MDE6235326.1 hypothetical protein [Muribaculaceae bacterium]